MHFSTAFSLAAGIATAQALSTGFNYGATLTSGAAKAESDFEAEFSRAQELVGTTGATGEFTSARLYTMIQGGTTDTPTSAIPAAINTKTSLLLGLWASAGSADFQNEINALTSAIQQYGSSFTSLVVGISVGSEDLYRVSPTGIAADEGTGAEPSDLVNYIKQLKSAISGTALSGASVGHVDTWTAWVNGSNSAVVDACDWIGLDAYPYFQNVAIGDGKSTFFSAFDDTQSAAKGKPIWITESGWPVSGPNQGPGVANVANAKTYWDDVACEVIGKYNTFWYTIQDAIPTTPSPSFGIIGSDLSSAPLYPLTCKNTTSSSSSSASSSASLQTTGTAKTATMPASAASGASTESIKVAPGKESAPASVTGTGVGGASGYAAGSSGFATATGSSGIPFPSSNGTSPGGYGSSSPSGAATGAASGAASGTAAGPTSSSSVTPSTGGADKVSAAGLAGVLAIVGLVAAL